MASVSVTDYLVQLQKLTKTNLEILKSLNDSFMTKQEHLYTDIDGVKYVIPSFISLENKVNALEENFINLVHAPQTSEAFFNLDGGIRGIEVRGYNSAPDSVKLNPVSTFNIEKNNVFKDFLTPAPYINFSLANIPNDITSVNIKKIIPRNDKLIEIFKSKLSEDKASVNLKYSDMYKILSLYNKDEDYIEYNTIKKLPIRKNIGQATYVIKSIVKDDINNYLENEITLQLRNDMPEPYANKLTYKIFDETIERPLAVGDKISNYDGTGLAEIISIQYNTNTITVRVLNGDFMNFVPTDNLKDLNNVTNLSKIKFYSPYNFDDDKYINVVLEEDQYVYVAIAPLNDRMNIQSSWGEGLIINTYMLTNGDDNFKNYYMKNVRNIGDILFDFATMSSMSLNKLNKDQFTNLTHIKPILDNSDLQVMQINKHLNDSKTVKNIRALYSQKKNYELELEENQTNIIDINKKLSEISFEDTSDLRSVYTAQLTELNKKKNELIVSISKIVNEISLNVNNSDVPIENAKYRIRGFFDCNRFIEKNKELENFISNHIIGIKVQYRYKNINNVDGAPISMKDGFVFSDWNNMNSFIKKKQVKYDSGYEYEYDNSNINEPSFNQIDIPISQGESVDIKVKVLYDYGYPYTETTSSWSDVINIKFPEEFLKDIQILDIIEENNNDIETNRFTNIMIEHGVPAHLGDKIVDQDVTYYHKPESIASGFYTPERRIIPLKDKLAEMNNAISLLNDELLSNDNSLSVSIIIGDVSNDIYPWQMNNISVEPYSNFIGTDIKIAEGTYNIDKNEVVSTVLNIVLHNTSSHPIKLYSIFPGSRDVILNELKQVNQNNKNGYIIESPNNNLGVWLKSQSSYVGEDLFLQSANQFITFRTKNLYTSQAYYFESSESVFENNNQISAKKEYISLADYVNNSSMDSDGAAIYPYLKEKYSLCQNSDQFNAYTTINPDQTLIVPMIFEYKLKATTSISKTVSFDLRPSLYKDPINYTFQVTAKSAATIQDKLVTTNRRINNNLKYYTTINK